MTKHHLEEPTVLYKASDELDLDRRPNKRSRKVTEEPRDAADDGAEATEKLLKKERKERKRLKKQGLQISSTKHNCRGSRKYLYT
jgi:hypothetical protein